MKKKHDIEIPITALSYLVMSIFYDKHGVASAVVAGLYVNEALITSARICVGGRVRGYASICIQANGNDIHDVPTGPGHAEPFDLDMGDACYYLSKCATDRVCAFLTEMRVPFQDFRKLAPGKYLPSATDGSNSGGSR